MWHWKRFVSKEWLVIPLLSLVLVAVACGAAEKPAPTTAPAAPKAPVAAPAPTPTLAAVATPAPASTPVPVPAAKVHPGKLTIMVGDFANERFDAVFLGGGSRGAIYGRTVHGFLISDNEQKEMVPGIASQWGLSADGLTWTFTIRKGVKFHDGSELTPEDVLWTLQHFYGPQAFEYTTQSYAATVSRVMDRIELSGPDKVSVTTKIPVTDFTITLSEAGVWWIHIIPRRAKLHDTEVELAYEKNPIGAGFMRLAKRVPGYVMKFERFDDFYYQPKSGFPEDKRVNFTTLDLRLAPYRDRGLVPFPVRSGQGPATTGRSWIPWGNRLWQAGHTHPSVLVDPGDAGGRATGRPVLEKRVGTGRGGPAPRCFTGPP